MTTRLSKIARLPKTIRDQLGARIEDNHPGTEIVQWLNSLPEAQQVLQQRFAGRPISEQNLSDWKQSGHLDWLRRQEARLAASQLLEQAKELDAAADEGCRLSDRFATVLTAELTRLAMTLLDQETDPDKKWQRLCHVNRELSRLRRDDHRATSATIKFQRWDLEISRQLADALISGKLIEKNHKLNILHEEMDKEYNAKRYGGGPDGHEKAELLFRVRCDLPIDDILNGTWKNPAKASPSPSAPRQGAGTACPRNPGPTPPANDSPQRSAGLRPGSSPKQRPTRPLVAPKRSEGGSAAKAHHQSHPTDALAPSKETPEPQAKVQQIPVKPQKSSLLKPNPGAETVSNPNNPSHATPIGPISPIRPMPSSIPASPASPTIPQPQPTPDPAQEAYNLWFRMNRGTAPFDPKALEKLYASIPPETP